MARRRSVLQRSITAVVVGSLLGCTAPQPPPATDDQARFLIANVRLVDGSGAPSYVADVRVTGDRVSEIAEAGKLVPLDGEESFDGTDLVLAPGFIDTHSHHDWGLGDDPGAWEAVSQGITTIVVGNDGASHWPLADFFAQLEADPVAVNVASYSGHNTLRRDVLGEDYTRVATDVEFSQMTERLRADLEAGALGLSTGLEYDPGIYSTTEEVIALAKVAAAAGGRYISHMRSEDRAFDAALDELLRIGEEAQIPVQISHIKLAMKRLWSTAPAVIEKLDAARARGIEATADIYPYTYWQSTMTVLFPDRQFMEENARFATRELAPAEGMWIAAFAPEPSLVGRTLAEIAAQRAQEPWRVYLDLIQQAQRFHRENPEFDGAIESIIATSMHEQDIEALLAWEHTNVCSDGALQGRHPRGIGTYPRILGRYVRERGVLSLEEAIHKMTGLAARHAGLDQGSAGRGVVKVGAPADLVLFDPDTVLDQATPDEPLRDNVGIEAVWVNGEMVLRDGEATGDTPGQVLRRFGS